MEIFNDKILPFPRSYWVLPGFLLAGHIPTDFDPKLSQQKIENLINLGIKTFINLQEEDEVNENNEKFPDYKAYLEKLSSENNTNLQFYRFPIKDLSIPEKGLMQNILDTINNSISLNRPVYVHCWGGIGRTGTVVGCFLLQNDYTNTNKVIEMIRYLRRTDPKNNRCSPETEEQVKFVLNWKK